MQSDIRRELLAWRERVGDYRQNKNADKKNSFAARQAPTIHLWLLYKSAKAARMNFQFLFRQFPFLQKVVERQPYRQIQGF